MMQKRVTSLKSLLGFFVPALLLALVLQPAKALAGTAKVTFESDGKGTVSGDYDLDLSTQASVYETGAVVTLGELRNPDTIQPNTGYVFDYWTADVILYRARFFIYVDPAPIGYHISSFSEEFYTASDVTLTAHFKRQPAKVTYTTDGHGSVGKQDESVEIDKEYPCGQETLPVGQPSSITATPTDSTKYEFAYWTASENVYSYDGGELTVVTAGEQIASPADYFVAGDVTFTAHFKQIAVTITYTSAGHGTTDKDSVSAELCETGTLPDGATSIKLAQSNHVMANPAEDYEFAYWKANKDVYTRNATGQLTAHPTGEELISTTWLVAEDITFTAYFKHKPATVTYTTDGHGSVGKQDESVEINVEYPSGQEMLPVGKPAGTTVTPSDSTKYEFGYWTADKPIYKYEDGELIAIDADTKIASPADYYVSGEVTFTAHFKHLKGDITYTTDGNGTVDPTSETVAFSEQAIDADGTKAMAGTPSGATTNPDSDYVFDYWTAGSNVINVSNLSVIKAGDKITNDQLQGGILITDDTTFEAHFKAKPVTVSYTTDGHGTVSKDSESVERPVTYPLSSDPTKELTVGQALGADTSPNKNYMFDYWTASTDVYVLESTTRQLSAYAAGTHLPNENLSLYYVVKDTTFTAHFLRVSYTVTYDAGDHGTASPDSETVAVGNTPGGCTIIPDDGYKFSHWTSNVDVEIAAADATQAISLASNENDVEPQASTTTIAAGKPITDEQLKRAVSFSDDPVFTAHYTPFTITYTTDGNGSVSVESETISELYANPVGSDPKPNTGYEFSHWTADKDVQIPGSNGADLITIAAGDPITTEQLKQILVTDDITFTAHFKKISVGPDGSGGKLTPKTGDTLPGATAAVALGAGVVVAGVALLRKRSQ